MSIDFNIPPEEVLTPAQPGRSGQPPLYYMPLSVLRKWPPVQNLDLRDAEGATIPLLTRSQNGLIDGALLSGLAEKALGHKPHPYVARQLGRIAAGRTDVSTEAFRELFLPDNLPRGRWEDEGALLREDPNLFDIAGGLARATILWLRVVGWPESRHVVKFAYDARADLPNVERFSPAHLGWAPFNVELAVPTMGNGGSYHLQVTLPSPLRVTDAELEIGSQEDPPLARSSWRTYFSTVVSASGSDEPFFDEPVDRNPKLGHDTDARIEGVSRAPSEAGGDVGGAEGGSLSRPRGGSSEAGAAEQALAQEAAETVRQDEGPSNDLTDAPNYEAESAWQRWWHWLLRVIGVWGDDRSPMPTAAAAGENRGSVELGPEGTLRAAAEIFGRVVHFYVTGERAGARGRARIAVMRPSRGFVFAAWAAAGLIFALLLTYNFALGSAIALGGGAFALLLLVPGLLSYVVVRQGEHPLARSLFRAVTLTVLFSGLLALVGAGALVVNGRETAGVQASFKAPAKHSAPGNEVPVPVPNWIQETFSVLAGLSGLAFGLLSVSVAPKLDRIRRPFSASDDDELSTADWLHPELVGTEETYFQLVSLLNGLKETDAKPINDLQRRIDEAELTPEQREHLHDRLCLIRGAE